MPRESDRSRPDTSPSSSGVAIGFGFDRKNDNGILMTGYDSAKPQLIGQEPLVDRVDRMATATTIERQ